MKRAPIIAVLIALGMTAWVGWPRIRTIRIERAIAKARQENHLPNEVLQALLSDPNLALFSIDPKRGPGDSLDVPRFRRYEVLGQTTVADLEQRQQLADTLERGLRRWSGNGIANCFFPRHAIRTTGGKGTFELLICFECGWVKYYPSDSKEFSHTFQIRAETGPFNDLLVAANVPLPRQPKTRVGD